MPVRIYDIAKKLGIESKEVLAKAKELGIAAKVPSSSIDKITGEFLEEKLALIYPHAVAPTPATPAPAARASALPRSALFPPAPRARSWPGTRSCSRDRCHRAARHGSTNANGQCA